MPDCKRSPPGAAVTIVTHGGMPGGAPDDLVLADALAQQGALSRYAQWDDPDVCWADTPLAIVRSTWDYHRAPRRWLDWIERAGDQTRLVNSPTILRWNTDKRYLRALADAGVACVPTAFVEPAERASFRSILQERSWPDVVIKPAIGASASGTKRFTGETALADGETHLASLLVHGAALVQPYLDVVETERERSLVFIDGSFAHAFRKPAFNKDAAGSTVLDPYLPTTAELGLAKAALDAVPDRPSYARVDMVPATDGPLLMELELIEPDLGLRLNEATAEGLAFACIKMGLSTT